MTFRIRALLVALILTLFSTFGFAAEYTWQGGASNSKWTNSGNWAGDQVPASASDTTIILNNSNGGASTMDIASMQTGQIKFQTAHTLTLAQDISTKIITRGGDSVLGAIALGGKTLTVDISGLTDDAYYGATISGGTYAIEADTFSPSTHYFVHDNGNITNTTINVNKGKFSFGIVGNVYTFEMSNSVVNVQGGEYGIGSTTSSTQFTLNEGEIATGENNITDCTFTIAGSQTLNGVFKNGGTLIGGSVTVNNHGIFQFDDPGSMKFKDLGGGQKEIPVVNINSGGQMKMNTSFDLNGDISSVLPPFILDNVKVNINKGGVLSAPNANTTNVELTVADGASAVLGTAGNGNSSRFMLRDGTASFTIQGSGKILNHGIILDVPITINGTRTDISDPNLMMMHTTIFNDGSITMSSGTVWTAAQTSNIAVTLNGGQMNIATGSTSNFGSFNGGSFSLSNSAKVINQGKITNTTSFIITGGASLENLAPITGQTTSSGLIDNCSFALTGSSLKNAGQLHNSIINATSAMIEIADTATLTDSQFTLNSGSTMKLAGTQTAKKFIFNSGSTYQINLYKHSSGNVRSPKLTGSESGTFATGSTINVTADSDVMFSDDDQFIIAGSSNADISIEEGVTVKSPLAVFKLTLGTDISRHQAILTANRMAYSAVASTPTAQSVGSMLDLCSLTGDLPIMRAKLDTSSSIQELTQRLHSLSPRQINFSQYSARVNSIKAALNRNNFLSARRFALKGKPYRITIDPAQNGIASSRLQSQASSLAQILPRTPGERETDRNFGMDKVVSIYGRATTGYTRVGSDAGRIGLRSSSVGAMFGFDVRVHENVIVGFSGNYDYSDVDFASHLGGGQVNSYRFGPYAMIYSGDWFFETEATIGLHDNKFSRRVAFMGVPAAKSNYDSIDFTFSVGAGYDFKLQGFNITPRVNLQYQFYHSGAFTETQAGSANLHVSRYETSAISSRLGVELWRKFEFESQMINSATPFFNIGWRKQWLGPTDLTSQFVNGGSAFNIDNDLFSRNAVYLGIGSTFELTDALNLDLRYQADLGDRENTSQNASINLRYRF